MKKEYKYIKQYSQDGILINKFKSASDAHHISHRDSIISCCKGKYNISGGFIWRFEEDPFDREIKSNAKKQDLTCIICNNPQSVRSMAMHLKNNHNITTEKYVESYGEFRPKQIKSIERTSISSFECMECGTKLKSNQHLMYHITKFHPTLSKHDYIVKYMYDDIHPLCKCGCGENVSILENGNNCDLKKVTYNRDYIKGHWDWKVYSNPGKPSKEQTELTEFIKSIYQGEIQTDVKRILNGNKELDIFLPELNIAIEYNGLYWHSERGGKFQDYHLEKFLQAKNKNIRLIQIFADEWMNKNVLVKNKLTNILNKSVNKIYARKCTITEIDKKLKNKFLNQYHIQGEDRSNIKLGIKYNGILVGVMTFSNPRLSLGAKPKVGSYELSRYATSCNIIGGASKLVSFFIKKYKPNFIYSYSDNRWTDPDNNMYLKLNFSKSKPSKPGYWYTKDFKVRFHRFNFNKFALKKMGADTENKTEKEIMNELGYTRVWDCGTTRYELDLNN